MPATNPGPSHASSIACVQTCCEAHDIKPDSNILTILDKGFQNEVVNLDFSSNYLGMPMPVSGVVQSLGQTERLFELT